MKSSTPTLSNQFKSIDNKKIREFRLFLHQQKGFTVEFVFFPQQRLYFNNHCSYQYFHWIGNLPKWEILKSTIFFHKSLNIWQFRGFVYRMRNVFVNCMIDTESKENEVEFARNHSAKKRKQPVNLSNLGGIVLTDATHSLIRTQFIEKNHGHGLESRMPGCSDSQLERNHVSIAVPSLSSKKIRILPASHPASVQFTAFVFRFESRISSSETQCASESASGAAQVLKTWHSGRVQKAVASTSFHWQRKSSLWCRSYFFNESQKKTSKTTDSVQTVKDEFWWEVRVIWNCQSWNSFILWPVRVRRVVPPQQNYKINVNVFNLVISLSMNCSRFFQIFNKKRIKTSFLMRVVRCEGRTALWSWDCHLCITGRSTVKW